MNSKMRKKEIITIKPTTVAAAGREHRIRRMMDVDMLHRTTTIQQLVMAEEAFPAVGPVSFAGESRETCPSIDRDHLLSRDMTGRSR